MTHCRPSFFIPTDCYQVWFNKICVETMILAKQMLHSHDKSTGLGMLFREIHANLLLYAEMVSKITPETV